MMLEFLSTYETDIVDYHSADMLTSSAYA